MITRLLETDSLSPFVRFILLWVVVILSGWDDEFLTYPDGV